MFFILCENIYFLAFFFKRFIQHFRGRFNYRDVSFDINKKEPQRCYVWSCVLDWKISVDAIMYIFELVVTFARITISKGT